MLDLFKQFQDVIKSLNEHKVDYILIGGYAVILYGLPRLTQDLDIVIKMERNNIKALRESLKMVFNDKEIEEITFEDLEKYAVIRYGSPSGYNIDLMASIGDKANFSSIKFEEKVFDGQIINIATPEALFDLKKDTVRPGDKRDAFFLKALIERGK